MAAGYRPRKGSSSAVFFAEQTRQIGVNHRVMYFLIGSDEAVHGPLSLGELARGIEDGRIRPNTLVSRENERWFLAFSLPDLQPLFLEHRHVHEPLVSSLQLAEMFAANVRA
jgi:hypothetical protein